jgi:hypothetical protein
VSVRIGQTGGIVMLLTRRACYGLLAAQHLAEHAGEGSFSANDLAELYGLPHEALAKILQRLATAGVLMFSSAHAGEPQPIPKLRKAPQPPLSHAGAIPDSDRAKRPPLSEPSATDQELSPGDRVEGLGQLRKADWRIRHS